MKSFISALLLTALLCACSVVYSQKLEELSQQLYEKNNEITEALLNSDFDTAAKRSHALLAELRDSERFLGMFGNHEETDAIEHSLAELIVYAENHERTAALACAGTITVHFEHLPKNTRITPENIL